MKFFGPSSAKWRPCKIFAKLNGITVLMANIFKLRKYQTFGLLKMHTMSKIWFANSELISEKSFGLRLTGCRKCYFSIFAFFIYPNLKWIYVKTTLFCNGFRGSLWSKQNLKFNLWSSYSYEVLLLLFLICILLTMKWPPF